MFGRVSSGLVIFNICIAAHPSAATNKTTFNTDFRCGFIIDCTKVFMPLLNNAFGIQFAALHHTQRLGFHCACQKVPNWQNQNPKNWKHRILFFFFFCTSEGWSNFAAYPRSSPNRKVRWHDLEDWEFSQTYEKKTTETTQNNLQHFTRTEAFFIEGRLVTTSASDLKCFTSFVWAHINPHTVYTITPCQILIHFSFTNKPTIYL